jgi:hypothetical protein
MGGLSVDGGFMCGAFGKRRRFAVFNTPPIVDILGLFGESPG